METTCLYAKPKDITALDECYFYHTIDLPVHGTIHGSWDLRGNLDAYLGFVDFRRKKVFDAGAGNGLLSFTAEQKGAREIIAFDLAQHEEWDHVPYAETHLVHTGNATFPEIKNNRRQHLAQLNNGFWFCHKALCSQVKMLYGNIYNIPKEVGPVDIALFGAILLHLKNPLHALEQAAKLPAETIVVTDICWPQLNNDLPLCMLLPSPVPPLTFDTWWMLTPALISQYLKILGYTEININYHHQIRDDDQPQTTAFFTVVGRKP